MSGFFISILDYLYQSLTPMLEIAILAILFYYILHYIRGTKSASVLAGIVFVFMGLAILADLLNFEVISWLLNASWTLLALALIVIFQPEFRRAFAQIGSNPFTKGIRRQETIDEIITAVINLAGKSQGALIVIEQNIGLRGLADNSVKIDARITHRLIETIFSPNTPLHDGGIIIKSGRIRSAQCVFPLSSNGELTKTMGTRHRAALGVTEETDALVVVVSEETAGISIVHRGNIKKNIRADRLRRFLDTLMNREKTKSFREMVDEMADSDEVRNFKLINK
jgi:diadenylate cyclase